MTTNAAKAAKAAKAGECTNCKTKGGVGGEQILLGKVTLSIVLLYMLYIAVTCPCKPYLDCHITQMYVAWLVVALIFIYFNGFRLTPLYKPL